MTPASFGLLVPDIRTSRPPIATRKADRPIYRDIVFKRWNNATMFMVFEDLTKVGLSCRTSAVHRIRFSVTEYVGARAVTGYNVFHPCSSHRVYVA